MCIWYLMYINLLKAIVGGFINCILLWKIKCFATDFLLSVDRNEHHMVYQSRV